MNKNQFTVVKEYEFDKPLIHKKDSIIDNCIRDCLIEYFHTFDLICVYDINFTNIANNDTVNLTISHKKSMNLYELNKKLTVARQRIYIFNQINKLTIKIYSNLSIINIHYYLKLRIPMCLRQFFKIFFQNLDYLKRFCNDKFNPFHFAIRE